MHTTSLETSGSNHPFFRPPLRSELAQTQRRFLQTELDEMWAAILVKRAHLNTLAAISYLPPEILGKIFHDVSRSAIPRLYHDVEDHELYPKYFLKKPLRSLVNLTHVCSRWRQVAIQHSRLWFYPPLELGIDWMKTMLLRSGSSPLVIEAHQRGLILLPEMIELIYEHLSHVQILHVSSPHDTLCQLFSKLIQPAPMLVSLTLDQPQNWIASPTGGVMSRLPQNLFSGSAPQLRELSLVNCVVPWNSTIFQNLSNLHINVPGPTAEPLLYAVDGILTPLSRSEILPSMPQLLAVLNASPRLLSIGLRRVLPHASSIPIHHPTSTSHDVCLPDLEDLSLVGTFRECTALLSHIVFPTRANLSLELAFDAENTEDQCTAFFDTLGQHYLDVPWKIIDTFGHFYYTDSEFELEIRTGLCRIAVSTPVDIATRTDFLRRYFDTIPLAEIFSLTFDDGELLLTSDQLLDVFSQEHLTGIYKLTIYHGRIDAFIAALRAVKTEPVLRSSIFPCLTYLKIEDFDFTEITHQDMVSLQQNLVLLLQERDRHCPFVRVVFSGCAGISETWGDALRVVDDTEIRCRT